MPDNNEHAGHIDDQSLLDWIDEVADGFESAWKAALCDASPTPNLEDYPTDLDEQKRHALLLRLIPLDIEYRIKAGERPEAKEYEGRFSQQAELVRAAFGEAAKLLAVRSTKAGDPQIECPPNEIGNYTLVDSRALGKGGQGSVYRYRHKVLPRDVAIKLPLDSGLTQQEADQFFAEGCRAEELDHPNFVRVFDAGRVADGTPYIAMELVDGTRADEALAKSSPREIAAIIHKVALAIDAAHNGDQKRCQEPLLEDQKRCQEPLLEKVPDTFAAA